jgi:hypothetical protein
MGAREKPPRPSNFVLLVGIRFFSIDSCLAVPDINECEDHCGYAEQQPAGDKSFGFREADGEDDDERGHDDVVHAARKVMIKKAGHACQNQDSRGNGRGDKRNFTMAFVKAEEAAGEQQDDVKPEDSVLKLHHAKCRSICNGLQVQNIASFTLGNDFKGAAADIAVGDEPLFCDGRIYNNFAELPAKRASHSFRNFHARSLINC